MQITFDTAELSEQDLKILSVLVSGNDWPAVKVAPPASVTTLPLPEKLPAKPGKKAPAAKAEPVAEVKEEPVAEVKEEPVVEPVVEGQTSLDDITADEPTMADAVAAATKLVSSGEAPKVKEALATVGAKRVSEVPADQIATFLAKLAA